MYNIVKVFIAGDFCCCPSTANVSVSPELKALISGADIKICNFETPLKPDGMNPVKGRLYNNDDVPDFLRGLGFDVFVLANNHAFDYGVVGYDKTVKALNEKCFGAGYYDEAYKVLVVNQKGKKIGFLALCFAANNGVFDSFSNKEGKGVAWIGDARVNHIIEDAKNKVDYLIVLPHDGIEYIDVPLPEIKDRYRDFIDYGADAVIASHPHCPQGWEMYKGRPVFYSLGNFFFNSKKDYSYRVTNRPHWYEGMCVVLNIDASSIDIRIIHTKNVDNVSLIVDHSQERSDHLKKLCSYLENEKEYGKYMHSLSYMNETEFRNIKKFLILRYANKYLPGFIKKKLAGKMNNIELIRLMKNDTRRNFFLYHLLNSNSFK